MRDVFSHPHSLLFHSILFAVSFHWYVKVTVYKFILLVPVVRNVDKAIRRIKTLSSGERAIHRINHNPVDSVVCLVNTYLLDSVIHPAFEQPEPVL